MAAGITKPQADCLAAIKRLTTPEGVSPSLGELRDVLGYRGRSAVHRVVQRLSERGLVTYTPHLARTLCVVEGPTRAQLEALDPADLTRVVADINAIYSLRRFRDAMQRADDLLARGKRP